MSVEDGRSAVPLVLLVSPLAPAGGVAALRTALGRNEPVLAPVLVLTAARPADLSTPALAVLAAVSASGADEAVLCGVGLGAMVALQVAATHPRRVSALVLSTAARQAPPTARSIHQAVTGVLPARALQVLPGGRRLVPDALDQVRAADYAPLTPLVRAPAQILYGELDRVNGLASRRLVRALADATAVPVAGCGPGWMWDEPERYAAAVVSALGR